ncbi:alpha amylase C-terminal domain-containing protein, partial [Selenomonas sp.]
GKKLLFMGGEFGQFIEWKYDDSLDWHLVQKYPMHTKMLEYSRALNKFYCENKVFWEVDFDWNGFQWIDPDDNENSVISFIRKAKDGDDFIIALCNFTPEVRHDYRIGVPKKGVYCEVFNSDDEVFGGSGVKNGDIQSEDIPWHNREQSIALTVPPLATVYLRLRGTAAAGRKDDKLEEPLDIEGKPETQAESAETAATAKTAKKTAAKKPAAKKPAAKKTTTRKTPAKKTTKSTKTTKTTKTTAKKPTTARKSTTRTTTRKKTAKAANE